jgi:hypothetical protein
MELTPSTPPISQDEYSSLLAEGTVFHECSAKTSNSIAFIKAIELKDASIKDGSKEALAILASCLNSAQKTLKNLDSSHCVRVLKEYCSELQSIQAKILQSQSSNRRKNIQKIFTYNDLEFAKSMDLNKVIVLTRFSPVSIKIRKIEAFCCKCRKSHASLKDFSFKTREKYLVLAGNMLKRSK